MKTIIAVILFGVLIYPSHGKIEYGKGECQKYGSMVSFDPKKFFAGNWSLTYSTRSERVTESTINRDYVLTVQDDGTINVTYGYNKNGCENHYEVHCNGTRNSVWDSEFNFDCHLHNDKEEDNVTHIDAYFIATDYDNYCVVYRCVKDDDDKFVEDNLFILFRPNKTDESYANTIVQHYGLTMDEFITRQNTTCPNSEGVEKKEQVEEGALNEGESRAQKEQVGTEAQEETGGKVFHEEEDE
uniref:Pallidipin-like lipocalin n=1 Tax=Triatoma infestans TaxID=30076 RepID=A6YPU1_TRIIF|nr:pallidipin-like lipocalin precursor [Triatoma infestans]